jgi:ElaB/YqjD/DUF883 family membrane-anchored ribosome-binding protein
VGEAPDRIRAEIEQTRVEMSETVDALGYKADVKTRAKENLQDRTQSAKESIVGVKDKIVGAGDSVTGTVSDRTPDTQQVKHTARRAKSVAQENPIGLAIGSIAVGFVAGMVMPATHIEDEQLGEMSDSVVEKVRETGQEALEHGKQVAQDVAERAQESGKEHAQQAKESAQETPTYQTHR